MSALDSNLTALLVKVTLILVAALAAHLGLRRASAATRHLSLTLAMLGLLLVPFLSLGLPAWQLEVLPQTPAGAPAVMQPVALELGEVGRGLIPSVPSTPATGLPVGETVSLGSMGGALQLGLVGWLFVAWTVGVLFVLSRLGAGLLRMRWVARNAERVRDSDLLRILDECGDTLNLRFRPLLLSSDKAGVPLVWGWLRPVLIVPREFLGWSSARMRAVMLHELGHLRRNDWPVLLLGRVVAALYWFHPLVWLLERQAKRECERACDDLVVTFGTKPSDYATHLLSIARGVSEAPASVRAALAVVRRSNLNGRLRSILDPLLRRNAPSRNAITALSTTLMLLVVPLAGLQFTERAHADEPREQAEFLQAQLTPVKERKTMADAEPSEGEQAYKRAYKLHSAGRYDEAADAFEEALDLGHNPGTSMYNIACCHALMGEAGRAMSWLEKATEAGFDDPVNLIKDSDFDPIRSDSVFQQFIDRAFEAAGVVRKDPEHYPYRSTLKMFDELKQAGSTNGKKWHHVGYKLINYRELDLAAEAFERAVETMPEGGKYTAMYNLACTYSLAGKTRSALDWLERSVDAGFDNHERFLNDSDLNELRGESEFERIAEKSEFLSLGRFPRRGWDDSDYSTDRWAPAIEEFNAYVADNPSSGRGWYNLGWALHFSERHDEAIGAFEKATALEFRPAAATYNVACANAMLGRTGAALDALEAAVESGTVSYGHLKGDDDLESLRSEPRYQALLEQLEEQHREYEEQIKIKKMQLHEYEEQMKKMKIERKDKQSQALREYKEHLAHAVVDED
jgi:beta-lactamase regulating signal transducer with metallopeptidase domain/Flp pilus assembly protein TadD